MHFCRWMWRQCKLPQGFGVVSRNISQKRRVQIFRVVAVFDAVFRSRCLMLVVVILPGLGEPDRRTSRFEERIVVAAASITIESKNQPNRGASINLFNRARKFARRTVAIVDVAVADRKSTRLN